MRINYEAIGRWSPAQCHRAMVRLNSETRKPSEISANLEFYREHCQFIVREAVDRRKAKYTPGPWKDNSITRRFGDHEDNRAQAVWSADSKRCICTAPVKGSCEPFLEKWAAASIEADANCRLIAAAPDMLAALWAIVNQYEALMATDGARTFLDGQGTYTAGQWAGNRMETPILAALAAIAKAEGTKE
jgi:hypothetical protein